MPNLKKVSLETFGDATQADVLEGKTFTSKEGVRKIGTFAPSAVNITYDNTGSGMTATNAQSAIDELASEKAEKTELDSKADKTELASKAPMYTYSQTDITAGTTPLETGKLYFVYE